MSYRFMRIVVFFDLPSVTLAEKREYRNFRKFLIKTGFIMVQESVYSKLALNSTIVGGILEGVKKNKPPAGIVQLLVITEKQYARMEFIVGNSKTNIIENDERLIIL